MGQLMKRGGGTCLYPSWQGTMPGTHPSQQGARSAGTEPRAVHQLGLPGPLHPSGAQQAVGVSPLCPCISKDTPVGVSRVVQTQTRGSLPGPGGSPSLRSRPLGVLVTPEKTKGESHWGLSHSSGACVLPLPCPGSRTPNSASLFSGGPEIVTALHCLL